jgi:glycosyltransferase involved in cell wall biosynthesis
MRNTVSVIIPAFNVETYLRDAVQSCIDQSSMDIVQIIVVDNSSTDRTLEVAHHLERDFEGRLLVLSEPRKGAGAARNCGLRYATGSWIQFLDADDLLLPGKIKHQLEILKDKPAPAFIAGSSIRQKANGHTTTKTITPRHPLLNLLWGDGECGNTCSNLWNRELVQKVNGFDESKTSSQEASLMFELLKVHPVVTWDTRANTIVRERREGGQISTGKQEALTRNFFDLRREIIEYILHTDRNILDSNREVTQAIYRSFTKWLLSEPETPYHRETLSFLIDNLYSPSFQVFGDAKMRYRMEKAHRHFHRLYRFVARRVRL